MHQKIAITKLLYKYWLVKWLEIYILTIEARIKEGVRAPASKYVPIGQGFFKKAAK
jgi:hypothetical protein